MKIKNIIIAGLIGLSLQTSFANIKDPSQATSLLSGVGVSLIVVGASVIPLYLSEIVADKSNNANLEAVKVNQVIPKKDKSIIQTTVKSRGRTESLEFEVDNKTIEKAQLKSGDSLEVDKLNNEFLLTKNNVPVALVQGKNGNFKQQKIK